MNMRWYILILVQTLFAILFIYHKALIKNLEKEIYNLKESIFSIEKDIEEISYHISEEASVRKTRNFISKNGMKKQCKTYI